jgi:hypothetical protein
MLKLLEPTAPYCTPMLATGVIKFYVNNRHACSRPWKHGLAYPTISCNVGELEVDVKWVLDNKQSSA